MCCLPGTEHPDEQVRLSIHPSTTPRGWHAAGPVVGCERHIGPRPVSGEILGRVPRLFVPADIVATDQVELRGALARHLGGALRLRPGEHVNVVTEADPAIECRLHVITAEPECVTARVCWRRPAEGEPRLHIEVIQALAKDGMDQAIDSMVEAGAAVVRPIVSARTISRPDLDRGTRRLEHWRSVARESAQLAFRARIPRVEPLTSLDLALDALPGGRRLLACALSARSQPLTALSFSQTTPVVLCIGPEGGLAERELELLLGAGAELVHLGARVLRARLAGAIATALVLAQAGDMAAQPPAVDGQLP